MSLRRFALFYLGTMLLLMVLVVLAQAIAGFDIANAGMAIIPAMCAGLAEGQYFVRDEKRLPEPSEMWQFSRRAAVVILGLTMVSVTVFSVAVPEIKYLLTQPRGGLFLLGGVLFQAAISFFLVRYFLGLGAKSAMRAEQAKAEKAEKAKTAGAKHK